MKILIVATVRVGYNGITNVILKHCKRLSSESYQFELVHSLGIEDRVRDDFELNNIPLHNISNRNDDTFKYVRDLFRIMKQGNYDIVHVHGNSSTMIIELLIAKLAGIKNRVAHGHSSTNKHRVIHVLFKRFLSMLATYKIACSKMAGEWTFGKNYNVVLNGVDTKKFIFDIKVREKYRKILGVDGNFVIGHVGHMTPIKNHFFLLKVFLSVLKEKPNSRLLLIGDGPLRQQIEKKVNSIGLNDHVLLLGNRDDVNHLYQAMDVFVLPSIKEGYGIATVEAQVSGLKCIVSEGVPEEVKLNEKVVFLPLTDVNKWRDEILKINSLKERSSLNEAELRLIDDERNIKKLKYIYNRMD